MEENFDCGGEAKKDYFSRLKNRQPVPSLFFVDPPEPWETPEQIAAACQSVWDAITEREHDQDGIRLAATFASDLWKACAAPPACPERAIINQYGSLAILPDDAVERVRDVLATILRWAKKKMPSGLPGGRTANTTPCSTPAAFTLADFQIPAREYLEKHARPDHRVTARELAAHLRTLNPAGTCSTGTVKKLSAWIAYQEALPPEQRRTKGRKQKKVSFTPLENTLSEHDDDLERLINEQNADFEPSPRDEDFPDHPRRVYSRLD